jgi:hypothetical protein
VPFAKNPQDSNAEYAEESITAALITRKTIGRGNFVMRARSSSSAARDPFVHQETMQSSLFNCVLRVGFLCVFQKKKKKKKKKKRKKKSNASRNP